MTKGEVLKAMVDGILEDNKSVSKRDQAHVLSFIVEASNGKTYNTLIEIWPIKEFKR